MDAVNILGQKLIFFDPVESNSFGLVKALNRIIYSSCIFPDPKVCMRKDETDIKRVLMAFLLIFPSIKTMGSRKTTNNGQKKDVLHIYHDDYEWVTHDGSYSEVKPDTARFLTHNH